MILQSLNRYYERLRANGKLLPEGFEPKEIPFIIVIDTDGSFVQIDDTRSGEGKARRAKAFDVPQGAKKTSGVAANLLWDTAEYTLGVDTRGNPDRVAKQHAAFKARLDDLDAVRDDAGLRALRLFLDSIDLSQLEQSPNWAEIRETNPVLSFRLSDDAGELIGERPAIVEAMSAPADVSTDPHSLCLVRGEIDAIARLHPAIKGVWGAQTSGANIVSFNLAAFNSYGKEQGANAPVGRRAVFNYTTALNHLLRKDSAQRIQVGGASTVFWASEETPFVDEFTALFSDHRDDPDRGMQAVRALHASIRNGAYLRDDGDTLFHVLGLAPNAARIAIRFWHTAPIRELAVAIEQHFADLRIDRPSYEREHLSIFRLLLSVATLSKADNIPPNLDGEVIRAILTRSPYPATLLQAAVRRCRAEREVTYPRAALLKASLNRMFRTGQSADKEISVSLDLNDDRPAYCLGRLFFLLERLQVDSQESRVINKTIADRYFGAASSAPSSVFPLLTRLHKHHLAKLNKVDKANHTRYEKSLTEVISKLQEIPTRLNLAEQGLFAIGYYHQKQHFYTPKRKSDESALAENISDKD